MATAVIQGAKLQRILRMLEEEISKASWVVAAASPQVYRRKARANRLGIKMQHLVASAALLAPASIAHKVVNSSRKLCLSLPSLSIRCARRAIVQFSLDCVIGRLKST
jgi:hypothetical protein